MNTDTGKIYQERESATDTRGFLAELTRLSCDYGVGISEHAVLFVMEAGASGDYERTYSLSPEGTLVFR